MYLNVETFFKSDEFWEIAHQTKCVSPQLTTHVWLLQNMTGLPVFGSGEGGLVKSVPHDYVPGVSPYLPSEWTHPVTEKSLATYRHCLQTGQKAIPGFFRYRPGQLYAFMDSPIVHLLAEDKMIGKLSTQTSKCAIYQSWFPDMTTRKKYSGFEKITEQEQKLRKILTGWMPQYTRAPSIEYHEFMRKIRGL